MTAFPAPASRSPIQLQTSKQNRFEQDTPLYSNMDAKWKVCFDLSVCILILLPMLCIMAVTAGLILLIEGRPIFYFQDRVGLQGRIFRILKFRTMRPEAEAGTGPVWSQANDSRVTLLGKWLRKSHLDELPQLFNVLRGDMSLVGPRPERPEFVRKLVNAVPDYEMRHQVRPGITGLAQLRLGYDTCVNDVASKTELDIDYIRKLSFVHDLKLLFETVPYLLGYLQPSVKAKKALQPSSEISASSILADVESASMMIGEAIQKTKTIPRRRKDLPPTYHRESSRYPQNHSSNAQAHSRDYQGFIGQRLVTTVD